MRILKASAVREPLKVRANAPRAPMPGTTVAP